MSSGLTRAGSVGCARGSRTSPCTERSSRLGAGENHKPVEHGDCYSDSMGWNEADIELISIFDMNSRAIGLVSRAGPPTAWSMSE